MPSQIGARIQEVMPLADFKTQAALARGSGINAATLCRIISGEIRDPSLKTLGLIADALGVTTDWLRTGIQPNGLEPELALFFNRDWPRLSEDERDWIRQIIRLAEKRVKQRR